MALQSGQRVEFRPTPSVRYPGTIADGPYPVDGQQCWNVDLDGDPTADLLQGRRLLLPATMLVET